MHLEEICRGKPATFRLSDQYRLAFGTHVISLSGIDCGKDIMTGLTAVQLDVQELLSPFEVGHMVSKIVQIHSYA